jgi:lysylphosphatidylglycerol synthetase-like protein (DUF2156 family)
VAGDPLCAPIALSQVLRAFLRVHSGVGFWQISRRTGDALKPFGYRTTHFAMEMSVPLSAWSLSGRDQQNLRTAANRARREGLAIVEARCEDFSPHGLMRLSAQWKTTKTLHQRDLAFFARPVVHAHEPSVRKFFALRDGVPKAMVVFDPMFDAGNVYGYVANILRQDPTEFPGLCDAVIVEAAHIFQREGVHELNLGMLPFCPPRTGEGGGAIEGTLPARLLMNLNWTHLGFLFNYEGIAFHKRRWRGVETPLYYAGKWLAAGPDFYAAARITGVL